MTIAGENTGFCDPCEEFRSIVAQAPPRALERLAQFALGSLLSAPFRHARSGDQRGGDGGVSATSGRSLVFEARRYGPDSRLDERAILGEIVQAAAGRPDLEAWILVTTREVPQQLQDVMDHTALGLGIGAISIDWLQCPLPKLAVLAATCPDHFGAEFGQEHTALLEQIAELPGYAPTLASIERECQSWLIGYYAVRDASHRRLRDIWSSRQRAQAKFHQNVAGGEEAAQHVRRSHSFDRLNDWFDGSEGGEIAALLGRDGVGKTWAALDWLQSRLDRLPIVVLAPSSALGSAHPEEGNPTNVIARYLHEVSGVRDVSYWEERVARLLSRPVEEGSVFFLFFDGLNQQPSRDWTGPLEQLEDAPFHQRTRTLVSARTTFFEERLHGLRRLIASPCRIDIGSYDLAPGGEFDRKLALAGVTRGDLSDHLIRHAAVPRMFDLIVRLRSDLGSVADIAVHRLLWAYGASAIQDSSVGAFSEQEWRQFLLELATDYRNGIRLSTRRRIETPDRVDHAVAGSALPSRFRRDRRHIHHPGPRRRSAFRPRFCIPRLGLALVSKLEKAESGDQPTTTLDQFLDPIAGYDDRAEILRAAVSIALLRHDVELPAWLGTLCTRWLHSQNLPETHLGDVEILAPELVTPMLDVIEASTGHSHTTPRQIAIAAVASVDRTDSRVAAAIAERGCKWQSYISLEIRGGKSDRGEDSFHAQRCKRLRKRIGTAESGPVAIADREFEIVERTDDDLIVAAAQLLQGRPLAPAIEFFVRGAIHSAVVGGGIPQEPLSWLNILNSIDPHETAAALRSASQAIRSLAPQAGHHRDLNARIASLLLWRTGYSEDAEEAWRTDPKIDHYHRYETDYIPDPSRSLFRLERRHAARVLCDKNVAMFGRIDRAKDALLDPSFDVPQAFVAEVVSTSERFEFSRTATGRGRTSEDLRWERLSLALARCAPNRLADCERSRLQQFADRSADQRFGSALVAPQSMLLVGGGEGKALQALRERVSGEPDQDDRAIQTNLLIAEIQSMSPIDQVTRILNSDLEVLVLELGRACASPSAGELDHLVDSFHGDDRMLRRLATVLAEHDLDLSQRSFDAFSELLFSDDADGACGAAWWLLGSNAPERLGHVLDRINWSWSSSKPYTENIMGSKAIAASNRGSSFSDFAARLAPSQLLEALAQDVRSREEAKLAVDLLSAALFQYREDAPKSGLDIFHDHEAAATGNYNFTIGDIVEDRGDRDDILSFFERASRPEQYAERRQEIIRSYIDAVRQARRSGAQLLHAHFEPEDFDLVLDLYPEALERWLEGMDPCSAEFRRKVRLAEGFFVGLCEALLKRDPSRGIPLWRILRPSLATRFIDGTGIDRLKYSPFAAPPCPPVDAVLADLYSPEESPTDDDLWDILVAARRSGRVDWLERMVSRDELSHCPAHRRRAAFLRPLLTRPDIAGNDAWPSSEPIGGYQEIHRQSWILGQREAFAAHWLRKFAEADTPETAHAFWVLFTACSDRRIRTWLFKDYDRYAASNGPIESAKQRFFEHERNHLKSAISENEKLLAKNFTSQRISEALLPWRAR